MEKVNVARTWGIAGVILALVVGIAALFLWISSPVKAQTSPGSCPPITVQWRSGSVLETMFAARVAEDNIAIKNGLQALAKNPEMTVDQMLKYVGNTYFKHLRLWTKSGWVETWEKVLPLLKEIVAGSRSISINTVSVLIEYQPYTNADPDIDAIAQIRMSFSASPGDNFGEGTLKHSRVCPIDP
jgi:hypothetical protein